jgi:hypothetical protein
MVMVKKEFNNCGNAFGIVSVVFGILSILSLSAGGVVMGIVGLIFGLKQKKNSPNSWSKAGIVLSIVGIILGIVMIVFLINYLSDYIAQLGLQTGY